VKVSVFFELPLPRPWSDDSEQLMMEEHLQLVEAADKVGIHCVWVTEHHFLEEYCHASAPEIFLAAASQRSKNVRLGHGIVHLPPGINHPARTAERVASLDCVSNGRVELGTGESSSVAELDGFRVDPGTKREQWLESFEVLIGCLADTPFTGFDGKYISMPPRNVIPKPVQKPHPPTWVACTRRSTIDLAARSGIGALSFSSLGPDEFREVADEYYAKLTDGTMVPRARVVNANIAALMSNMVCARDDEEGAAMVGNWSRWFPFGVGHYYLGDAHQPGVTNLRERYDKGMAEDTIPGDSAADMALVGSPDKLRRRMREYEGTGVDEVIFWLAPLKLEYHLESFERLGRDVLPEFIERDERHVKEKAKRLEPVIEAAMKRRRPDPQIEPGYEFSGIASSWDNNTPVQEIIESMSRQPVEEKYAEKGASLGSALPADRQERHHD
jgi:alkanesulfonate monooxygenase SsuD/methylene tetrahydromethanopterin reductase-like flavin-dependent oxidoreductase (luciferase family)